MKLKVFCFEISNHGTKRDNGRWDGEPLDVKFEEVFDTTNIEETLNDFLENHNVKKVDIQYQTLDRHNNGRFDTVVAFYHVWYE